MHHLTNEVSIAIGYLRRAGPFERSILICYVNDIRKQGQPLVIQKALVAQWEWPEELVVAPETLNGIRRVLYGDVFRHKYVPVCTVDQTY